jgi:hypothetical protein
MYGGMIKAYCIEKNIEERDLSEEEIEYLKKKYLNKDTLK